MVYLIKIEFPQDINQLRVGKIVRDKYPELDDHDREAVRQRARSRLLTYTSMQAKAAINSHDDLKSGRNTSLIDGVRKFTTDVRELDIDLIDSINPFKEIYAILAKSMDEDKLETSCCLAITATKHINMTA